MFDGLIMQLQIGNWIRSIRGLISKVRSETRLKASNPWPTSSACLKVYGGINIVYRLS